MSTTPHSAVAVLGVPFHNVTMEETVDFIDAKIQEGGFHQIATANVDFLIHAIRDRRLQEILCNCDLVIPDGMPIVWAARMLGTSLKQRVCGVDLVPRLAALSAQRGYSIYLLGASERNSAQAAENLQARYPGLRIAGRYSPPVLPLEQMDHEDILRRIERAKPDILLVAMGNPKQEKWLAMHRQRLNVPVCIGVGGSVDFVAGAVARAPRWMQNHGLEWLYRASQEPRRLAKRYIGDALGFARYMPQQLISSQLQPRHKTKSGIFTDSTGNTKVVSIYGDLTGSLLPEFDTLTRDAVTSGMNVILNMSHVNYVGPDALGSLIHLESAMREAHEQLWLAEPPPHLLRVLHGARLNGLFMSTSSVTDALHRTARAEERMLNLARYSSPLNRSGAQPVQIRVELLQDVCQKVTAANQPLEDDRGTYTDQTHVFAFHTSLP